MALPSVPTDFENKPTLTTPVGKTRLNAILAWMREVALAWATGVLNADTVSGAGIGVVVLPAIASNAAMQTTIKSGMYLVGYTFANGPWPGEHFAYMLVMSYDTTTTIQVAFCVNQDVHGLKTRSTINSGATWTAWNEIFTSTSAGNGGQPPAPKPNATANTIGLWESSTDHHAGVGGTNNAGTYSVMAFDAAGHHLGDRAGLAYNADLAAIWATCTNHMYYRTA